MLRNRFMPGHLFLTAVSPQWPGEHAELILHRDNMKRINALERKIEPKPMVFRRLSLNSTIPELPGSGWLAAEPEATPQMLWLRPWGFPTVSPSHPVFPHHGIQRITVEFSEKSRFSGIAGCRNVYFFLPHARPVPVKSWSVQPLRRCPAPRRPMNWRWQTKVYENRE